MPRAPLKPEDLLESLGDEPVCIDDAHCRSLRRALLRTRPERPVVLVLWTQLVQASMPVLAGGMVVTAVVVVFGWGGESSEFSPAIVAAREVQSVEWLRVVDPEETEEEPDVVTDLAIASAVADPTTGYVAVPAVELFGRRAMIGPPR